MVPKLLNAAALRCIISIACWYQNELTLLPVGVCAGKAVTAGQLKDMGADVIVLATGFVPIMPEVPGIDGAKVIGCMDAFSHPEKIGKKVIVIGGGLVGCEMALDYTQEGKKVTVVEALPKIFSAGIPSPIPNGRMIPERRVCSAIWTVSWSMALLSSFTTMWTPYPAARISRPVWMYCW